MEKFFLNLNAISDKLDVINNQNISTSVVASKVSVFLKSKSVNEFLQKLLARNINYSAFLSLAKTRCQRPV